MNAVSTPRARSLIAEDEFISRDVGHLRRSQEQLPPAPPDASPARTESGVEREQPSTKPDGNAVNGWLGAALLGKNGRSIGIIQLSDKIEGEFTAEDEALLMQLSQMAAGAIENGRLYEELRENDRRKDEFLAMLAHELRNPLAAVGNAVTVLKMSDDAGEYQLRQGRHRTTGATTRPPD